MNEFVSRIISTLEQFSSPPWTIQRISELLLNHGRYWSSVDKFIFAFSKVVFGIKSNKTRFRLGSWSGNDHGELSFVKWPNKPIDEIAMLDRQNAETSSQLDASVETTSLVMPQRIPSTSNPQRPSTESDLDTTENIPQH
uniref:Uncharacterized protein n=2 Tax=Spongospora subterranea TaxID=70186 RepID=A0A0H5QID3_9EUKA|eukprot:CRZ01805.1 hypothetical protein [Spongospora subterranea]